MTGRFFVSMLGAAVMTGASGCGKRAVESVLADPVAAELEQALPEPGVPDPAAVEANERELSSLKPGDELYVNTYIFPPPWLTSAPGEENWGEAPEPDPEGPWANFPPNSKVQEFFEATGVEFPPGAEVFISSGSTTVIMRNTLENLERVDAAIREEEAKNALSLRFRLDIFEADSEFLYELVARHGEKSDHSDAFDELMSLDTEKNADFVTSLIVEARNGQRAQVENGVTDVTYLADFEKKEGEWVPAMESREVGTIFELDPVLAGDQGTIDLNFSLEHHFAPPSIRKHVRKTSDGQSLEYELTEFYYAQIVTQVIIAPKTTRILGLLKPPPKIARENPGRSRIAFLHADLIPIGANAERVFSEKQDLPPRP